MNRFLASLSVLTLGAFASAQCFESNLGTSIGSGDDSLLAVTPMNITFPMGGIAATYTHIQPNTNGLAYLTNGVAAVGGTSTGYSSTAATMVTNLRGLAGQNPRISPYWRDLNLTAANSAGVFVNNTIAGKCVVTWKNAVHFGQTTPVFTVQAQLFSDGHVVFFYSGTTQNTAACPIVGISQGNLVADPGLTDLSVGSTGVSTTQIMYETFATLNTFDLANMAVTFTPNAAGGYDESAAPCVPASHTAYGAGCAVNPASVYEMFTAPATFDLNGVNIEFNETAAGGWTVGASTGPTAPVAPVNLVLGDDAEVTQALTTPFAASVNICSNGFISVGGSNGTGFSPSTTFLNDAFQTWRVWHDMNPSIVGSGQVSYENIGGAAGEDVISYNGVWDFGGTTAANANTFQFALSGAPGARRVRICITTMSGLGNGVLVGYSPAGPSLDPGSKDLSVATLPFSLPSADVPALGLAAAPAPVLGTNVTWTVSGIRSVLSLSAIFMSFGQTAPVALGTIGLDSPGCFSHLDLSPSLGYTSLSTLLMLNPTDTCTVTIPTGAAWAGVDVFTQAASLAPLDVPSGVITSNGLRSRLQTF